MMTGIGEVPSPMGGDDEHLPVEEEGVQTATQAACVLEPVGHDNTTQLT